MKTYAFSLASATDTVVFDNLVRVIRYDEGSGTGTPKIRIKALSTGEFDVEMVPGRQIKLPEIVRGLVITNLTAAAITGKLTIGAGDISDNSLVGTVTLDAATLAALESIDLNAATVNSLTRPGRTTGSFSSQGALAANTALQVFAAASNPNGAIILSAGSSDYSASGHAPVALISNATVPANPTDGDVYGVAVSGSPNAASQHGGFNIQTPMLVPAGHGLYFISGVATTGSNFSLKHCRYKLL